MEKNGFEGRIFPGFLPGFTGRIAPFALLKNCTFPAPKITPFSSFYSFNSYKISLRFMGKCDKI
jgi:hypothetical protein